MLFNLKWEDVAGAFLGFIGFESRFGSALGLGFLQGGRKGDHRTSRRPPAQTLQTLYARLPWGRNENAPTIMICSPHVGSLLWSLLKTLSTPLKPLIITLLRN